MAVYTKVSAEDIDQFLQGFDVGTLISAKGIAEGVENRNYLIETTENRFILTLYEKRVDPNDLPFFLGLLDDLASAGLPVPPAIKDKSGNQIQQLRGKTACLIQFLPGVSVSHPSQAQAAAAGEALAQMHAATIDYTPKRKNSMGPKSWHQLSADCGVKGLEDIQTGLAKKVKQELQFLDSHWPTGLRESAIHADLFPDNVLMLGDKVAGVIDFYFSCTDFMAYDFAITPAAWCFSDDGTQFTQALSSALISGYKSAIPIVESDARAYPILARGAALRFLLTRAYDWINTPADALVTRKDPIAFLRGLEFYQQNPDVFSK